ncbi:MAG: hypothetical protein GDA67_04125 [Nitrospira sp. CR1.3]|nr:hypothetical protein [Nitrospira sp. CR1.3]
MTTTLREQGIESIHDQVVSLVAQRWAKAFHCKVTIHTGLEQNPWADPNQQCDIVGWYVTSGGNTMEWMAEVETEDSLADSQTVANWRRAVARGVPFYLLVPRGTREAAQKLAQDASVMFSCVYEYTFMNDICHIL